MSRDKDFIFPMTIQTKPKYLCLFNLIVSRELPGKKSEYFIISNCFASLLNYLDYVKNTKVRDQRPGFCHLKLLKFIRGM